MAWRWGFPPPDVNRHTPVKTVPSSSFGCGWKLVLLMMYYFQRDVGSPFRDNIHDCLYEEPYLLSHIHSGLKKKTKRNYTFLFFLK